MPARPRVDGRPRLVCSPCSLGSCPPFRGTCQERGSDCRVSSLLLGLRHCILQCHGSATAVGVTTPGRSKAARTPKRFSKSLTCEKDVGSYPIDETTSSWNPGSCRVLLVGLESEGRVEGGASRELQALADALTCSRSRSPESSDILVGLIWIPRYLDSKLVLWRRLAFSILYV